MFHLPGAREYESQYYTRHLQIIFIHPTLKIFQKPFLHQLVINFLNRQLICCVSGKCCFIQGNIVVRTEFFSDYWICLFNKQNFNQYRNTSRSQRWSVWKFILNPWSNHDSMEQFFPRIMYCLNLLKCFIETFIIPRMTHVNWANCQLRKLLRARGKLLLLIEYSLGKHSISIYCISPLLASFHSHGNFQTPLYKPILFFFNLFPKRDRCGLMKESSNADN